MAASTALPPHPPPPCALNRAFRPAFTATPRNHVIRRAFTTTPGNRRRDHAPPLSLGPRRHLPDRLNHHRRRHRRTREPPSGPPRPPPPTAVRQTLFLSLSLSLYRFHFVVFGYLPI
jgi:hypothetical protein